ncbi:sugar kinase [Roseibium sp. SCPC15]|uniref:sugar kinase n=1 Tax=Roseibium sp. SCP15 TaxID=3141376 RepID=UPI003338843E
MVQRFLAIGECMIEMSPTADGTYALGYAGDTFNTAWYVRQVSKGSALDVSYFSAVGDDQVSADLIKFMQSAGIETHMARVTGVSSGLYMIFLDDGERSFQYWRSTSAARQLADHLDLLPRTDAGDVVYFSGITVAILPEDGRRRLLERLTELAQQGATVVFDPNLRPRLWEKIEDMRDWTMKSAATARIVLPSFADEAEFFGDRSAAETADRYLRNGATLAVVKDGPEPVVVKDADGHGFRYRPQAAVDIVDTTAAGDSFNAAFLVEYLRQGELQAAVEAGCELSRKVISQRGALVPIAKAESDDEPVAAHG